ncbi:MAG: hypothetical protein K9G49_08975 [Taibaiella sp.]|nr:hypothetical protein [Taibaiella sp.]
MKLPKTHLLICCLWLYSLAAKAQIVYSANWGANVGVVAALGNRFQRIGVTLQAYNIYNFAQINAEVRVYRNFKTLGPPLRYNELVTSAGLLLGYGATQTEHNPFLSVVGNQTRYRSSVGYAHNVYFNKIKTTQRTGTIAFQFGDISILSENDIFARTTLDRFRTGAFLVQYQYKNRYQYAINCTMWTGQMGNKVTGDKDYPHASYMDTTNGVHTRYSHGMLSAQFRVALNGGQNLQANVGIDAEQVRNTVQNRLIHDLVFIPRKWHRPKSCDLPMLDTAGNQYLHKAGQKLKPARLYWNVFTGAATFY